MRIYIVNRTRVLTHADVISCCGLLPISPYSQGGRITNERHVFIIAAHKSMCDEQSGRCACAHLSHLCKYITRDMERKPLLRIGMWDIPVPKFGTAPATLSAPPSHTHSPSLRRSGDFIQRGWLQKLQESSQELPRERSKSRVPIKTMSMRVRDIYNLPQQRSLFGADLLAPGTVLGVLWILDGTLVTRELSEALTSLSRLTSAAILGCLYSILGAVILGCGHVEAMLGLPWLILCPSWNYFGLISRLFAYAGPSWVRPSILRQLSHCKLASTQ